MEGREGERRKEGRGEGRGSIQGGSGRLRGPRAWTPLHAAFQAGSSLAQRDSTAHALGWSPTPRAGAGPYPGRVPPSWPRPPPWPSTPRPGSGRCVSAVT